MEEIDKPVKVRVPCVRKDMVKKVVKVVHSNGMELQKKRKKAKLPVAETEIRKLLAASTPQMALALINMALDEDLNARERLAAIKYSMDRCYGTPKEHIVVDQKVDSFTSALIDMTKLYEQLNSQPVLDGKIDSFNSGADVIDCPLDDEAIVDEPSSQPLEPSSTNMDAPLEPSLDCQTNSEAMVVHGVQSSLDNSSTDCVDDDSQNPAVEGTPDGSPKTIPFTIPLNDTTINRHNRNIRQLERAVKEELKSIVKNSIKK